MRLIVLIGVVFRSGILIGRVAVVHIDVLDFSIVGRAPAITIGTNS